MAGNMQHYCLTDVGLTSLTLLGASLQHLLNGEISLMIPSVSAHCLDWLG
jgi:hypothetical protein